MKGLYEGRDIEAERRKVDGLIHLEIATKIRIAGQLGSNNNNNSNSNSNNNNNNNNSNINNNSGDVI